MERTLYLALGDSITRGYSATHPAHTFVSQVSGKLKGHGSCTETMVIAQNGWTTQNLWRVCQRIPDSVWTKAAVLSLMVGGNDLRRRYYAMFSHPSPNDIVLRAIQEYAYTLGLLCDHIDRFNIPCVVMPTLYNPVPNSQLATMAIKKLNEVIRNCAEGRPYHVVPVDRVFAGRESELIHRYRTGRIEDLSIPSARPIHPNNAGHRVIADEILQQIERGWTTTMIKEKTAQ